MIRNPIRRVALALTAAAGLAAPGSALADPAPLIPRNVIFGNPERATPQISPDGTKLAWIAPDKKNVLQVWVKTIGKDDDKVLTADKKRGIRQYFWAWNNEDLLYCRTTTGTRTSTSTPRISSRAKLGT